MALFSAGLTGPAQDGLRSTYRSEADWQLTAELLVQRS